MKPAPAVAATLAAMLAAAGRLAKQTRWRLPQAFETLAHIDTVVF